MIDIYRIDKETGIESIVEQIPRDTAQYKHGIMAEDEVQASVVVSRILDVQVGDYIILNDVRYTLNRDVDYVKHSDVQHAYTFLFESPLYSLFDKLFVS